ncbi:MAG: translation initiation factor IF-2 [Candidatus Omnitrophota bacterium]|nr:translation initiation factor IF-2 [Candidatus Omnitrophota bacterium]
MRVAELAKELKITSSDLLLKLKSLKISAKNSMANLDEKAVALVRKEAKKIPEPRKLKEAEVKPIKPAKKKIVKPKKALPKKKDKAVVKKQPQDLSITKAKEAPPAALVKVVSPKSETPTVLEEKETPVVLTAEEKLLKEIQIEFPISVKDLAVKLGQKPSRIIKDLLDKGIFVNINQFLDDKTVNKIAQNFGMRLSKLPTHEEKLIESHKKEGLDKTFLSHRSPVVTFMGHVDHGKTSLLDFIRKSRITEKEHGGITQHIGAYSVNVKNGRITFLDTPGHEAFTAMRARGADITDIVVLVVAADEGVMPQTIEAINHARAAEVPIIVAINKIDKPQAQIDKVKKQLSELELTPEDWSGKTITVGVSAKTGDGIDSLLEMILLEAEMMELKANYQKKASGIVVEARLTKDKGPLATLIVQNGILHLGDEVIAGTLYGKLRAMFNDRGFPIKEAGPAMPVEALGLSGVPDAGEKFYVVEDEKAARQISQQKQELFKQNKLRPLQRISLEDLYAQIKEGKLKELKIVLKADVQGSLEALEDSLKKLPTDEVQLRIIHSAVGSINTSDVILAAASDAVIIGFNVEAELQAKEEEKKLGVDVRTYRIIYDALNDIKAALEGLLEPKLKKNFLGKIEVRQVFKLSKSGIVAGCFVVKGNISRQAEVSLVRNGQVVFEGKLASLKRFKDDVREVNEGFECGLTLSGFEDIQAGDVIEAFEIEKIARKL